MRDLEHPDNSVQPKAKEEKDLQIEYPILSPSLPFKIPPPSSLNPTTHGKKRRPLTDSIILILPPGKVEWSRLYKCQTAEKHTTRHPSPCRKRNINSKPLADVALRMKTTYIHRERNKVRYKMQRHHRREYMIQKRNR